MKPVGVITRAKRVSVWERQIAFKHAEMAEEICFGVSLLETRGTEPRLALIANCCEKAGYSEASAEAQSPSQKNNPGVEKHFDTGVRVHHEPKVRWKFGLTQW
jgi:hypothetical protein